MAAPSEQWYRLRRSLGLGAMAEFLAELKRRQMFRVAAAYAVVAWLLLQLINNLTPALQLPDWAATFVVVLLIVGFPIALLFSWIQHLPADGATQTVKTGRRDWLLIGALGLVMLLIGYQQIAPSSDATRAGVEAARDASASPATAISLAVLPFENLSGDASQEFFSDGMTEEITSALARIPDLRVVARTSAYQFRSQNRDIQTIGQQLNATHFIEGSVRMAGERVRITAQLIKANDGVHVWTETYDRQLTDIFAIQEEIGRAIAGALRMPLGLKPGENLVNNRAIDPDSYGQFLRAKALLRVGARGAPDAIAILEPLVARSPNYAPAWEELGLSYFFMTLAAPAQRATYIAKMEAASDRAVALDPNSGVGRAGQLWFKDVPRKWAIIEDAYVNALSSDPYRPDMLQYYSDILRQVGRVKENLAKKRQLMELEPLVPNYTAQYAQALWLDGQTDDALKNLEKIGSSTQLDLKDVAQYHASLGRFQEAADAIARVPQTPANAELLRTAESLLRSAPAKVQAPEKLPALSRIWGFIYLYIGAHERVLDSYEQGPLAPVDIAYLWHPSYSVVRKTDRFRAFVRKFGLVDYWRERGWPAVCHPTTGDDFVCD